MHSRAAVHRLSATIHRRMRVAFREVISAVKTIQGRICFDSPHVIEGLRMLCARLASGCSQNAFGHSLTPWQHTPLRILVITSMLFKKSSNLKVVFLEKRRICSNTHTPSLDEAMQCSNYRLTLLCRSLGHRWGAHRTTGVVVRHR